MLTVKMFAKKFPDIWARDANFGRFIVGELADIEKGQLKLGFEDLGNFPYFGPITEGWFAYSFEVMGLKNVKVALDPVQQRETLLHFRIQGMILVEPTPEAVVFDTDLQIDSKKYVVRG